MARSCSICTHPQTADITKTLTAGVSVREVASRFGLTSASVHRHTVNCLRLQRSKAKTPANIPAGAALEPKGEPSNPKDLLRRAETLLGHAETILGRAAAAQDDKLALQALRETRSSIELMMRAHGMLTPEASVTINVDARRAFDAKLAELSTDELRALAYGTPIDTRAKPSNTYEQGEIA